MFTRYRENVKRLQSLLRDQPETPMERAIFWIEYAIRHNGAPALSLASRDLNYIQRNLIDVYLILALMFIFLLSLAYYFICFLFRKIMEKTKICT